MTWSQIYDPLGHPVLSTLLAALPILVLLGSLGLFRVKAHYAALLGLTTSLVVAVVIFRMPGRMILASAAYGGAYGLFPIGWIVLNVIFLYQLTNERSASGLSLIANTAPVAFGALGAPLIGLQGVTGLDLKELSAMVGRQLPFFSLIVPFWLIWAFAGFRGMLEIWPAILVAGVCFAIPQFLVSNFHGPWLVDVVAAVVSMAGLAFFLKLWQPQSIWRFPWANARTSSNLPDEDSASNSTILHTKSEMLRAWLPWIILSVVVFVWGLPQTKVFLDGISALKFSVSGLDKLVLRVPPVVAKPTAENAVFNFNWLSASGSGILLASIIAGLAMGYSVRGLLRVYWKTLKLVRFSLLTIATMMSIGFTTRYSGMDATLGLAFANSIRFLAQCSVGSA